MTDERACTKQQTLGRQGNINTVSSKYSLSFHVHVLQVKIFQACSRYGMQSVLQIWPQWALLPCPALLPYLLNRQHTAEYNNDEKIKEVCKKCMTGMVYFCAPPTTITFSSGINEIILASVHCWKIEFIFRFPIASSNGSGQTSPLNMLTQRGLDCSWWHSQTCK